MRQTPSIIFWTAKIRLSCSDGYRTTKDMQRIFKYVDSKSLKESLSTLLRALPSLWALCAQESPAFSTNTDLSAVSTPLR